MQSQNEEAESKRTPCWKGGWRFHPSSKVFSVNATTVTAQPFGSQQPFTIETADVYRQLLLVPD
jgi:hypothetical protein